MKNMKKLGVLAIAVAVGTGATAGRCGGGSDANGQSTAPSASRASADTPPAYAPQVLLQPSRVDKATEARVFDDAARSAWDFFKNSYTPATGLAKPSPDYPYPTVWDIASTLAADYSARGLGLITEEDYQDRARHLLETLNSARLYQGFAYGRNYNALNGELVGLDNKTSQTGTGYSAIDLGRLLIWLKIVEKSDPALAPLARSAAQRINAKKIIRGGYFQAEQTTTTEGLQRYQEGRIGYEQYMAAGFQLWGLRADRALNARNNVQQINVDGVPLWTDRRGLDRITSEPFIIYGLELGLSGDMQEMAWQAIALQAKRYEKTNQITLASEDALKDPPYFFYYYCVYCSGQAFVINVHKPGVNLDAPRWISAKAAYAWYALLPSKYTWMGIESVHPAREPGQGWATGVYEKTAKSTEVLSLNTAAIILEAALYHKSSRPLLH